jgi:hypothetical protein
MNWVQYYSWRGWFGIIIFSPYVFQLLFNTVVQPTAWYANWPLVFLTSLTPLMWLLFKKKTGTIVSVIVQLFAIVWFDFQQYASSQVAFSGESAFVGGLGVLYVIVFSIVGGIVLGAVCSWMIRTKTRDGHKTGDI